MPDKNILLICKTIAFAFFIVFLTVLAIALPVITFQAIIANICVFGTICFICYGIYKLILAEIE